MRYKFGLSLNSFWAVIWSRWKNCLCFYFSIIFFLYLTKLCIKNCPSGPKCVKREDVKPYFYFTYHSRAHFSILRKIHTDILLVHSQFCRQSKKTMSDISIYNFWRSYIFTFKFIFKNWVGLTLIFWGSTTKYTKILCGIFVNLFVAPQKISVRLTLILPIAL